MEIKECPFCGSEKEVVESYWLADLEKKKGFMRKEDIASGTDKCMVKCPMCGATGPKTETDDQAVTAWNEAPREEKPAQLGTSVPIPAGARTANTTGTKYA